MSTDHNDPGVTSPIVDDEKTAQRAYDVIAILAEAFDTMTGTGQVTIDADKGRQFLAVFGWWAWITRSSRAVVHLHKNGLAHEAAPNVRSILEHTLVLQWVTDVGDDALDAIAEHAHENTRKLIDSAQKAQWALPEDVDPNGPPKPDKSHPLTGLIKNFADLCIAYNAGVLYVPYRLLSSSIHPSSQGAGTYVDRSGTLHSQPVLQTYCLLIHTAASLIQATRTINRLLPDEQLSTAIAKAEARFGSEVELWTLRKKKTNTSAT